MPEEKPKKEKRETRKPTTIELASRDEHRIKGRVIRAVQELTPARAVRVLEDVIGLLRDGPAQQGLGLVVLVGLAMLAALALPRASFACAGGPPRCQWQCVQPSPSADEIADSCANKVKVPTVELSKLITCPDGKTVHIDCEADDETILHERCHLVPHPKDPGDWEVCAIKVKRPARTR